MPNLPLRPEPLTFDPGRRPGDGAVGCVHPDGSITYRGRRYPTLRELPPDCTALRTDLASTIRWRSLYRAIDPTRRRSG